MKQFLVAALMVVTALSSVRANLGDASDRIDDQDARVSAATSVKSGGRAEARVS